MKTKIVFCAREQKETEHTVSIDKNGEFLFECACGGFIKLPANVTKEEIKDLLDIHKKHNEGQVTTEELEKEDLKKLKLLDEA